MAYIREEQYTLFTTRIERFIQKFSPTILDDDACIPMNIECALSPSYTPWENKDKLTWKSIKEGDVWGESWQTCWCKFTTTVPSSSKWIGKHGVADIDLHGEALVYDSDGKILHGLTNGSVFDSTYERAIVHLGVLRGGDDITLYACASCNTLFGIEHNNDPKDSDPHRYGYRQGKVNRAKFRVFHPDRFGLRCDVLVMYSLLKSIEKDTVAYSRLLYALTDIVDLMQTQPDAVAVARHRLSQFRKTTDPEIDAVSIGHAHIDTAWLWPIDETIRKTARTFSNQLDLMSRYPDYKFGASSALHYDWMKQYYPDIYAGVGRAVARGQWEIQSGTWVECDMQVTGGESLFRQFLTGKQFFKREFNIDVDMLWEPDSFGYSASLPQISVLCGCRYFVTQKLCWNQFNSFPYHTFVWRGMDGQTQMISHFPPENTYNGDMRPASLRSAMKRFKEKGIVDGFLVLYGVGDGGGGPHEEMVELALRQRTPMADQPRVVLQSARSLFTEYLEPKSDILPRYIGELYLEFHRGTLTTQAHTKRRNRRSEQMLVQLEVMVTMVKSQLLSDNVYEHVIDTIKYLWRVILSLQFHDILPGSSITRVYTDATAVYAEVYVHIRRVIQVCVCAMKINRPNAVVLVNTGNVTYNNHVYVPKVLECSRSCMTCLGGHNDVVTIRHFDVQSLYSVESQELHAPWMDPFVPKPSPLPTSSNLIGVYGDKCETSLINVSIPPYTVAVIEPMNDNDDDHKHDHNNKCSIVVPNDGEIVMYNQYVKYVIDITTGQITITDKHGYVYCRNANSLHLYVDLPNEYGAWDVDVFVSRTPLPSNRITGHKVLVNDDDIVMVQLEGNISNSTYTQRFVLRYDSARMDIETFIDWREKHKLLKTTFPVEFQCQYVRCDIAAGYLDRETHTNTSWQAAMFEVSAHKYAAIYDRNHAVVLLNDCKYGHSYDTSSLSLSLLRSSTDPDPDADKCAHWFKYSVLPINGHIDNCMRTVYEHAYTVNTYPVTACVSSPSPSPLPVVQSPVLFDNIGSSSIVIFAQKPAESGHGIVLRLAECGGQAGSGTVTIPEGCRVYDIDAVENNEKFIELTDIVDCKCRIELSAFEIMTLLIR